MKNLYNIILVKSTGSVLIWKTLSGSDLTDNFSTRILTVNMAILTNLSQNVSRFNRIKFIIQTRFCGNCEIDNRDGKTMNF